MSETKLTCDCDAIHQDAVLRALKNRPADGELDQLSELFKILGDRTRINILQTLDQNEMCVCDLANVLNMTKSSISHQLAVLRAVHIIKSRRAGKEVYYTMDDEHVTKLYELGLAHIEHLKQEFPSSEQSPENPALNPETSHAL